MHPFTVLATGVAAALLMTASASPVLVGCGVLCAAGIATWRKILPAWTLGSLAVLAPLWISQFLVHAVSDRRGAHVLWQGGWVRITQEGLATAAGYGLRVVPLVCVGILCFLVLDRMVLLTAVDESPLPATLGYVVTMTLGLLPQLRERSRAISEAQAVRGTDLGRFPLSWGCLMFRRAVPLVTASVDESSRRAVHLQSRGFPGRGNRIRRYRQVPDGPRQRAFRRAVLLLGVSGSLLLWAR